MFRKLTSWIIVCLFVCCLYPCCAQEGSKPAAPAPATSVTLPFIDKKLTLGMSSSEINKIFEQIPLKTTGTPKGLMMMMSEIKDSKSGDRYQLLLMVVEDKLDEIVLDTHAKPVIDWFKNSVKSLPAETTTHAVNEDGENSETWDTPNTRWESEVDEDLESIDYKYTISARKPE